MEAWSAAQNPAARHSQLEFLYYDPDVQHDIIVVFDLLDRVKAGFFQAVFIAPPASTWSRSRHLGPTQTQLRSRTQPLGLPSLGALAQSRISEANRTLEVCTWLVQQALFAKVPCVLLFPEDLGGHSHSGPSSPWALQDWRFLEGLGDARRGSAFLCRLAAADHRRPTGFVTNLVKLILLMVTWWASILTKIFYRQTVLSFPPVSGSISSEILWQLAVPRPLGLGHLLLRVLRQWGLLRVWRTHLVLGPGCMVCGSLVSLRAWLWLTLQTPRRYSSISLRRLLLR